MNKKMKILRNLIQYVQAIMQQMAADAPKRKPSLLDINVNAERAKAQEFSVNLIEVLIGMSSIEDIQFLALTEEDAVTYLPPLLEKHKYDDGVINFFVAWRYQFCKDVPAILVAYESLSRNAQDKSSKALNARVASLVKPMTDLDEVIELRHFCAKRNFYFLALWNRVNQLASVVVKDPSQTTETLTLLRDKLAGVRMPYWLEFGDPSWALTKAHYDTRIQLTIFSQHDPETSVEKLMENLEVMAEDYRGLYEKGHYCWSPASVPLISSQTDRVLKMSVKGNPSALSQLELLMQLKELVGYVLTPEKDRKKPGGWGDNNPFVLMAQNLVRKNPREFVNHPHVKIRQLAAASA